MFSRCVIPLLKYDSSTEMHKEHQFSFQNITARHKKVACTFKLKNLWNCWIKARQDFVITPLKNWISAFEFVSSVNELWCGYTLKPLYLYCFIMAHLQRHTSALAYFHFWTENNLRHGSHWISKLVKFVNPSNTSPKYTWAGVYGKCVL